MVQGPRRKKLPGASASASASASALKFWQIGVWLLIVALLLSTATAKSNVVAAEDDSSSSSSSSSKNSGKCAAASSDSLYFCSNCGGIYVKDCLVDCLGYSSTDTLNNICFKRKLFNRYNTDPNDVDNQYHYLWNDLAGMVIWFICAGVATACGVGGGGIYVPLGILLFQFSPKQASGLSQASIFGASLGGLLLNARNQHPYSSRITNRPGITDPNNPGRRHLQATIAIENNNTEDSANSFSRPLINFDMALFLAPMEMAGAVLGVLIQQILPNWLYLLFAALVLSFTAYKTYNKYFAVRQKEREAEETNNDQVAEQEATNDLLPAKDQSDAANSKVVVDNENGQDSDAQSSLEHVPKGQEQSSSPSPSPIPEGNGLLQPSTTISSNNKNDGNNSHDADDNYVDTPQNKELRLKYLQDDMRQYPKEKIIALIILWIGLFILILLKGGKGVESLVGITCSSPWYAVLIALQFLWIFGFASIFGYKLMINQANRVMVRYPYFDNDPIWDGASLRFYGMFTFIAGIVAGLIGIGGGMVLGPLMLVMGIHPSVSSATTATMIVLTSSSVAVIFVTSGLIPWSYAVFYFGVCLSGAYVGKYKIDGYVKRTGRASLLIFILATIIALATIGCIFILLTKLADNDWCFDGFNEFCTEAVVGENNTDGNDGACSVNRLLSLPRVFLESDIVGPEKMNME